ncbi:hypothetical protein DV737_g383, partial [Chaetothyriales sp. CBS 132003]
MTTSPDGQSGKSNFDQDSTFSSSDATPTSSTHGGLNHDIEKSAERDVEPLGQTGPACPPTATDEKAAVAVTPAASPGFDPASFPDGGLRAWLVVLGAFCSLIVSFGWINCIGVFQAYYETHQLREYSSQEIAWVPSLESFMMFVGGLWVGRVYDNYGPRYLMIAGTFLHVLGLMMTSISTKYWHFILSQGLCSALGASMIFYPAMSAVVTWFFKKRAFALGVAASGSGLGGVIFPIMVQKLIPEVGFGWSMRICAFLILGLMIVANITVVSRLPPQPRAVSWRDFVMPFTELPFFLLSFGSFLMFMAADRDVPESLLIYLLPILNSASVFGRIVPTFVADKVGRFTTFLFVCATATILIWAIWLPGSGTGATVTFAVLFGFASGAVVALPPTLVASISDVKQIGVRTGATFSLVAIAVLVGNPIGGQIVTSEHGSYQMLKVFSGCLTTGATICYALLRFTLGGLSLKNKV